MRIKARHVALIVFCAGAPSLLLAYGTRVHRLLPGSTLDSRPTPSGGVVAREVLPPVANADLVQFRAWLWNRSSRLADTTLRRAFLRRYPTAASFDARALREFLMMNGRGTVLGFDTLPAQPLSMQAALELGSTWPDLDRRNQSRLLLDAAGAPRVTRAGDTVPFDPMTLNMGRLGGLSSQAHAHMGLSREPKSSDPAVLKSEPWNFTIATGFPGPVETYGPDNAQIYTDLSLLAALDGRPAWRALSALYAGNAMHYVADVGNAIHTVQVGIYPIFKDATIQAWMRKAGTLFGLLGTAPGRNAIGLDIIINLHSLSERLYEWELTEALAAQAGGRGATIQPSIQASLRALESGDDSLGRVLADTLRRGGPAADFGRAIAVKVVDANVRDGAEVYRVTRDIISSRLRVGRLAIDFDTVPDGDLMRHVRVRQGALVHSALDDFNAVHARGLARTTTALRAWWDQYLAANSAPPNGRAAAIERTLTRLVSDRLRYLDAAESRRAEWIAQHGGTLR